MADESRARLDCGVETEQRFPDAVAVSRLLLNLGARLLRRTGERDTESRADEATVAFLLQSQNTAMACLNLLCEGYPRHALHLARFVREGHIAFRWSAHHRDAAAQHFTDMLAGTAWPRGTWPSVGEMARQLPSSTVDEDWYQEFQRAFRDTHNEIYSHAVSDWALRATMRDVSAHGWTTALGPTFDEVLVAEAFSHLIPLFALYVMDCADFVEHFTGTGELASELQAALDQTVAWIADHPTAVVRAPGTAAPDPPAT